MANPHYQFVTTATNAGDGLYLADWLQSPFNMSYEIEIPAGITASFLLQYTLDDVNDPLWTPIWLADPTNGTSKAVSVGGNYQWPIRALRLNVASLSGSFTYNGVATTAIRFAVLQGVSAR